MKSLLSGLGKILAALTLIFVIAALWILTLFQNTSPPEIELSEVEYKRGK